MSYYEDYVADGFCCSTCGEVIDNEEPGYPRMCEGCKPKSKKEEKAQRNADRVKYAIEQFKKHNVEYVLKNKQIGHFHTRRKTDDTLIQFWAGTGKIIGEYPGERVRGIHNLIKILEGNYNGTK